jgi:hypothetical protein
VVRAVLERVMRVKLDMDAVYAADAAAAQEALRVVALETPEHEFLVRLLSFGPLSVSPLPPACSRSCVRKRCYRRVSITTCGDYPKILDRNHRV